MGAASDDLAFPSVNAAAESKRPWKARNIASVASELIISIDKYDLRYYNRTMSSQSPKIAVQIRRVINRAMLLEKRSTLNHEALRLYPSEIHLLQVINEGTDMSAGEMARKLGISNGAVSQTLNRLEIKGVIKKTKDPALKNRLSATLTEVGQTAIRQFEQGQEATMKAFSSYLSGLSEGERKVIEGLLSHLEVFLKNLG